MRAGLEAHRKGPWIGALMQSSGFSGRGDCVRNHTVCVGRKDVVIKEPAVCVLVLLGSPHADRCTGHGRAPPSPPL